MIICVTGPTQVNDDDQKLTISQMFNILFDEPTDIFLNVGDNSGLDSIVRKVAIEKSIKTQLFMVQDTSDMRMVDASLGGILYAFPDKDCPAEVTPDNPFCDSESNIWATIAYAKSKDIKIKIYPLVEISIPGWLY